MMAASSARTEPVPDGVAAAKTARGLALWLGAAIGGVLGIATFFTLLGPTPLEADNIGWLFVGDSLTYYLGGAYFQETPWMFPPGLNPRYGLDVPNSIYLTDSVPLLAYAFKIIHAFTGRTVQYMGVWLFICFTLQGLFGWVFASFFTRSHLVRASTAVLLLFMPAFLIRTQELVQYPTSAHFLVLAALVLYLSELRHKGIAWIGLGVVAMLSQSYFFVMVAAIWVADLVQRGLWKQAGWRAMAAETFAMPAAAMLALWLSGFFIVSSGMSTEGFGYWRSNLLSPFDSHGGTLDWSYFLPSAPKSPATDNGRNFYGTGIIALLFVAVACWIVRFHAISFDRRVWPLVVVTMLMFVFALSNNIAVGRYEFHIPLPQAVLRMAGLLRVSDRFVWPLMYVGVGLSVSVLCQTLNRFVVVSLIGLTTVLQVVDTHVAWQGNADRVAAQRSRVWPTILVSPFWDKAGAVYKNLRRFPIVNREKDWEHFAYLAFTHRMATNTVYQSRFDEFAAAKTDFRFLETLKSGRLDADTLYVLDERYADAARDYRRSNDLLKRIDGYLVLAPNWESCPECKALTDRF